MKTVDRNLYAVEITEVDKARKRVKIHFTGYSEKFDEWRPCHENYPVIRLEQMSQLTVDGRIYRNGIIISFRLELEWTLTCLFRT